MDVATVVGVLCARVRMEEKSVIEALGVAGVAVSPLPPFVTPLPVGPSPIEPLSTTVASGAAVAVPGLVIDRLADRALAGAIIPAIRAMGAAVVDAGLAASGNRYATATALAVAGLPRPRTLLVTSEDAGLAAVSALGCPATMLPLDPGADEISFFDRDIAEAVLEHREVLGGSLRAVALIQGGICADCRTDLIVVGGRAVGASESGSRVAPLSYAIELAEATARVLGAALIGVSVVNTAEGAVVWDVQSVPSFRSMTALGDRSIAEAIAGLVMARQGGPAGARGAVSGERLSGELLLGVVRGEVSDGAILTA